MDNKQIQLVLENYFNQQDGVAFVYLFGSFVKQDQYRDIDVALFTEPEIDLIRLGTLQAELSSLIKADVDIVLLNDLHQKNPAFVHEVLREGKLLKNSSPDLHTQFKRDALIRYCDTAYLRNQMEESFTKRLKDNKFGMRNYE